MAREDSGCPSVRGRRLRAGPEEVAAVRVSGDLLADYHRAVHELHPALSVSSINARSWIGLSIRTGIRR
jgi:hypothetical protein